MDNPKYLMWTGDYVGNSLLFWREGKAGYTTDIQKAHEFELEEAIKIQNHTHGEHQMIPVDHCHQIATSQVHADHLNRELIGKEVSNG